MKVKCKVCGEYFEKENVYCDFCAAKYGAEKSKYDDIQLFENSKSMTSKESRDASHKQQEEHKQAKGINLKDLAKQLQESQVQRDTESGRPERIPDIDTTRELKKPRKKSRSTFRSIILFIVFMNIITGFLRDADIDGVEDFLDEVVTEFSSEEEVSIMTEEAVPINNDFPNNEPFDFKGEASPIIDYANGIFEGTLSTPTYLNYESKELRFPIGDDNYEGLYQLPIYATLTANDSGEGYYFDIWDQNTLKMLGSYNVATGSFDDESFKFIGEPTSSLYDDPDTVELTGYFEDTNISGRVALPYTLDNEVYYFEFDVDKINDDASFLLTRSYIENEYYESFMSEDGTISIDAYTYEEPQGYPHSSMYYDGILVLTDGAETYPPIPFYISDGELFATFDYLDTDVLAVRETGYDEYLYYDEIDTQLYQYHPIDTPDSLYTLYIHAEVISEDDDTILKGNYEVYNRHDGKDYTSNEFYVHYMQ